MEEVKSNNIKQQMFLRSKKLNHWIKRLMMMKWRRWTTRKKSKRKKKIWKMRRKITIGIWMMKMMTWRMKMRKQMMILMKIIPSQLDFIFSLNRPFLINY